MQGTHRLFVMITLLYSSKMLHGTIPTAMNISTLVPVPKNKKKSLNSSDNYRAIALSSTVGKIREKVILLKYSNAFITSDEQFGFQQKHSTIKYTFTVNEIINHYNRNGTDVKAILLDASKAFDRVQYVQSFRLLLCRKICPLVIRCLLNMYTQQQVCVRCGGRGGGGGGGVIQPTQLVYPMVSNKAESCHRFILTVYMDELLVRLGKSRCGCYIGNIFCGALSYADDVIILAPTMSSVYSILNEFNITKVTSRIDALAIRNK